jgi:hypothetical protein
VGQGLSVRGHVTRNATASTLVGPR